MPAIAWRTRPAARHYSIGASGYGGPGIAWVSVGGTVVNRVPKARIYPQAGRQWPAYNVPTGGVPPTITDNYLSESVTVADAYTSSRDVLTNAFQANTRIRRRAIRARLSSLASFDSTYSQVTTLTDTYTQTLVTDASFYTQNTTFTETVTGAVLTGKAVSEAVTPSATFVSSLVTGVLESRYEEVVTVDAAFVDSGGGARQGVMVEAVNVADSINASVTRGIWTMQDQTPATWTNQ
jgi:hypothetical protein